MAEIHIPERVKLAATEAIRECRQAGRSSEDCAFAAITAALAEWVKCGMARDGLAFIDDGDWFASSMWEPHETKFTSVIIRTEAP